MSDFSSPSLLRKEYAVFRIRANFPSVHQFIRPPLLLRTRSPHRPPSERHAPRERRIRGTP